MNNLGDWYRQVIDYFYQKKVPIFIHGSTLLGAVRNKELLNRIPFDKEINIGIRAEDLTMQLLSDMKKDFPYFHSTGEYHRENSLIYFGPEPIIRYLSQNKDHWDMNPGFALLAVFWRGKTKWIEYMGDDACLTWPLDQLESFSVLELDGRRVNIPASRHLWLAHYFGVDYMEEKRNWHWGIDSKNFESYKKLVEEGELC
jgi:hypothetical protein